MALLHVRSDRRAERAATLVEVQIASAIGALVVAAVLAIVFYTGNAFAHMGGYVWMESSARKATDIMLRDIRRTLALTAYTSNSLTFADTDGVALVFRHIPTNRTVVRVKGRVTDVILKDCDALGFVFFKAGVTNDSFNAFTTTVTNEVKMIQVNWTCSWAMALSRNNLTNNATFKVGIRNK